MGISIVSLRNEGLPTFCLCLTMEFLWINYGIWQADGCAQTPHGAMLRWPFCYHCDFMYAAVSD